MLLVQLDTSNAPRHAWVTAEPVVERLALDAHSWVDVVRGMVPLADQVHHELETTSREQGKVFRYDDGWRSLGSVRGRRGSRDIRRSPNGGVDLRALPRDLRRSGARAVPQRA
jgi:hypothetical protein